jgi:hypothetical protein
LSDCTGIVIIEMHLPVVYSQILIALLGTCYQLPVSIDIKTADRGGVPKEEALLLVVF